MTGGTSIKLPEFFFGFGKKLQGADWVINYRPQSDEERIPHRLQAAKSRNMLRIDYYPATQFYAEKFTFSARPSIHQGDERWFVFKDEEDFWEFSHTFDTSLLEGFIRIPPPSPASRPVRTKCRCGKHKFTEKGATKALLSAKMARSLRSNQRRRECRVYPCPTEKRVFHLTSQPGKE